MDIRKIKKLIELVEESGIAELEITEGEESVRIHRGAAAQAVQYMPQPMPAQPAAAAPVAPAAQATTDPICTNLANETWCWFSYVCVRYPSETRPVTAYVTGAPVIPPRQNQRRH